MRQQIVTEVEDVDAYPEMEGLRTGVIIDTTRPPLRVSEDGLRTLPARYFGASDLFIDGFLGRSFTGPVSPERAGQYVYGERKRLEALGQL